MRASPEDVFVGRASVDEGGLPGLVSLRPLRGLAMEVLDGSLRGVVVDIVVVEEVEGMRAEGS